MPNNSSAVNHSEAISRAIRLELDRGHTCGPFCTAPLPDFRVNPLSARIKSDGSARLILDLSQPRGDSVNDGIDPEAFTCTYTSVDDAISLIFDNGGRGALIGKADIKHAFRLIPVRPDQWHLLGYRWNGCFYFDTRLSFGSRSSPRIFNDFADCLCWLFRQEANNPSIHHYLDDFYFVANSNAAAARSYQTILTLSHRLGVPLAPEKCVPPTTRLVLLGVELDTTTMTISLPSEKAIAILDALRDLYPHSKTTKRQLLSLVGKLVHASKCVPPGRGFTRRLLDAALTATRPGHRVRITAALRRDLQWWLVFLPRWNGTFPLIPPRRQEPDLTVFTDSSGRAGAAVQNDRWVALTWPPDATAAAACSMTWLEMLPVLAAMLVWSGEWRGRRVRLYCDNMGVIAIWRRGWSHNSLLMDAIRHLLFLSAAAGCVLELAYIPSADNTVADALSRGQLARARRARPSLELESCAIPTALTAYLASPLDGAYHLSGHQP